MFNFAWIWVPLLMLCVILSPLLALGAYLEDPEKLTWISLTFVGFIIASTISAIRGSSSRIVGLGTASIHSHVLIVNVQFFASVAFLSDHFRCR